VAAATPDGSDTAERSAEHAASQPPPAGERAPATGTEQLQAALDDYLHPEPDMSLDL